MVYLIDYFNSVKDRLNITVTCELLSAGTLLLTDFEGKLTLKVDELDCILFHVADREVYQKRRDNYHFNPRTILKQDLKYNKIFAKKLKNKGILTDKQIKQYLDGKNVVVYKKTI